MIKLEVWPKIWGVIGKWDTEVWVMLEPINCSIDDLGVIAAGNVKQTYDHTYEDGNESNAII